LAVLSVSATLNQRQKGKVKIKERSNKTRRELLAYSKKETLGYFSLPLVSTLQLAVWIFA
jgi:hypothetical protein